MTLGYIGCAIGRHTIDKQAIKHIHGTDVGRCRHCSAALEHQHPDHWVVQQVRDAGLSHRFR
ncbi:hypothetical protein [Qipengyuania marisflavi]|uniref:Uncharacterized protein n=1 Tax=Qipengyuania marisflavi TaxID=2486356 RepID=A0A5S3P5V1_9SPHN|nr:hypothetical protein [Qipengyuania marisflavi]TMM48422.1 hypothetical protein FEV51_09120 [Qipengyuania marisflavi]